MPSWSVPMGTLEIRPSVAGNHAAPVPVFLNAHLLLSDVEAPVSGIPENQLVARCILDGEIRGEKSAN